MRSITCFVIKLNMESVTPNCAESVERPKNGAEKPIKAKTVERTGSQATTKATAVSLSEPEDCHGVISLKYYTLSHFKYFCNRVRRLRKNHRCLSGNQR